MTHGTLRGGNLPGSGGALPPGQIIRGEALTLALAMAVDKGIFLIRPLRRCKIQKKLVKRKKLRKVLPNNGWTVMAPLLVPMGGPVTRK